MKVCTKCGIEKSVAEFGPRESARDGLKPHCRECEAAYQRARFAANPELIRERKRLDMARARQDPARREAINAARRGNATYAAKQREYRAGVRRRHFFVWRARGWNNRHGASVTSYQLWRLWRDQRGQCALSGRKLDATAHLDHIEHLCREGSPEIQNLRWIDPRVNVARSNMTDGEFVEMCHQVVSTAAKMRSPTH